MVSFGDISEKIPKKLVCPVEFCVGMGYSNGDSAAWIWPFDRIMTASCLKTNVSDVGARFPRDTVPLPSLFPGVSCDDSVDPESGNIILHLEKNEL
jgi:hypothetical protein